MLEIGFVKIDRKITQWRWYHDANTFRVFFHLIVTSNYEDKDFETITIKRGERVISYPKLAAELGLTEQNIRTAIKHLKDTGEVTVKSHSKFSVVTVNNYNQYQSFNSQLTDNQQSVNSQLTDCQQATNNNERKIKKDKESKKDKEDIKSDKPTASAHKKPVFKIFGEYRHIKLTQEQYDKLVDDYGEKKITAYIREMDEWIQLKGKNPYKDFNLAIRKWLNNDNIRKGTEKNGKSGGESHNGIKLGGGITV